MKLFLKNLFRKLFFFSPFFIFFSIMLPSLVQAVPPPVPLPELCKNSDIIVLGKYVGGEVTKPKDCKFWVTFQVKPEKFFKGSSSVQNEKILQFRRRYFVDTKECALIPGPNAMPAQMEADLKLKDQQKKVFFLKEDEGVLKALTTRFWSIVYWDKAPEKWHEEFKNTPACNAK